MRVTERIEDYIREQIKAKIEPKYEVEKAESLRIFKLKKDIESRALDAAKQAAMAVFAEAKEHGDFFELDEDFIEKTYPSCYHPLLIKNFNHACSVHRWRERMRNEINKNVDDIIVTLELGGNKADLDRMLSEI